MKDLTIFVKEATKEQPIASLENILVQMKGIERALVDTEDGEVKIIFDEEQLTPEMIKNSIEMNGMHVQ